MEILKKSEENEATTEFINKGEEDVNEFQLSESESEQRERQDENQLETSSDNNIIGN